MRTHTSSKLHIRKMEGEESQSKLSLQENKEEGNVVLGRLSKGKEEEEKFGWGRKGGRRWQRRLQSAKHNKMKLVNSSRIEI